MTGRAGGVGVCRGPVWGSLCMQGTCVWGCTCVCRGPVWGGSVCAERILCRGLGPDVFLMNKKKNGSTHVHHPQGDWRWLAGCGRRQQRQLG